MLTGNTNRLTSWLSVFLCSCHDVSRTQQEGHTSTDISEISEWVVFRLFCGGSIRKIFPRTGRLVVLFSLEAETLVPLCSWLGPSHITSNAKTSCGQTLSCCFIEGKVNPNRLTGGGIVHSNRDRSTQLFKVKIGEKTFALKLMKCEPLFYRELDILSLLVGCEAC